MRKAFMAIIVCLGLLIPVSTATPAQAATKRCGKAYDLPFAPRTTQDQYLMSKPVQRYQVRQVSYTGRLCAHFKRVNRNYRTWGHIISWRDTESGPVKKTCASKRCKFVSDDGEVFLTVSYYYKLKGSDDTQRAEGTGKYDIYF